MENDGTFCVSCLRCHGNHLDPTPLRPDDAVSREAVPDDLGGGQNIYGADTRYPSHPERPTP
ncbi:MAG: hypothetical protein EXR76_03830 [Myxococcales bacterium]|nr:hypothetical protein [Myxococcales bacterium]